jgi:hypothetical protein
VLELDETDGGTSLPVKEASLGASADLPSKISTKSKLVSRSILENEKTKKWDGDVFRSQRHL